MGEEVVEDDDLSSLGGEYINIGIGGIAIRGVVGGIGGGIYRGRGMYIKPSHPPVSTPICIGSLRSTAAK
jgi:hypothetical protein